PDAVLRSVVSPAGLLPALLDESADELLSVLLEHLVYLVQNRVDVVRDLFLPFLDVGSSLGLSLVDLIGALGRALLPAGVFGCHHQPPLVRRVVPRPDFRMPRPYKADRTFCPCSFPAGAR